jgi:hypothetical protein
MPHALQLARQRHVHCPSKELPCPYLGLSHFAAIPRFTACCDNLANQVRFG